MAVRAVSFDADGTLWDFHAGMLRSLAAVLDHLKERVSSANAQALTVERLIETRDDVAKGMAKPGLRPTKTFLLDVRRAAFGRTLETIGVEDEQLADELNELYFEHRWAPTEVFPDVFPALSRLEGRYILGILTNGNSKLESTGLEGRFAFVVYADEHGVEKPGAKLFLEFLKLTECEPYEVVHVGDTLLSDVAGAQAVGIPGIWLNRSGVLNDSDVEPYAEISSLSELPAVIAGLGG